MDFHVEMKDGGNAPAAPAARVRPYESGKSVVRGGEARKRDRAEQSSQKLFALLSFSIVERSSAIR